VTDTTETLKCNNCREELEPEDTPIYCGERVFCCEACAFECGRSKDCGGRADSHNKPIVERA
jgi:hypothetical protein